ncbi:hypothetical protein CLU79DRAFT_257302 [Phycomyces nitens]|nr:hypothetical protein CLU79DRAFT_257302 [Phycomyces nitens]
MQVNGYDNPSSSSCNNHQKVRNTIIDLTEDELDILSMSLPLRPGSDLFNKNLLRDQTIKNIIITAAIGDGVTGDAYYIGANEQHDGRRAAMIYFPLKEFSHNLAPVIVEIQSKVDHSFVSWVIQYCLNLFDNVKVLPVLVVIGTGGFSSNEFRDSAFDKSDNNPFYTNPCRLWAKQTQVYTPDSIEKHMESSPIDPMVALVHVLILQEKNIIILDEYNDTNIQAIYKIAMNVFSCGKGMNTDSARRIELFCDAMTSQFANIFKCEKDCSERSRKRLCQYAQDGINFAQQFKRQNCTESPCVTIIGDSTPEKPSGDLTFVTNAKGQSTGRFTWASCYKKGRSVGMFTKYSNSISLKQAYSNNTL